MALFPIEFYVPRNELDATKEIMYNSINKRIMSEWNENDNTRKSHNFTEKKELHLEDLYSSSLNHNLLLIMYSTTVHFLNFIEHLNIPLRNYKLENKTSYNYFTYLFFILCKFSPNNVLCHFPKQIRK